MTTASSTPAAPTSNAPRSKAEEERLAKEREYEEAEREKKRLADERRKKEEEELQQRKNALQDAVRSGTGQEEDYRAKKERERVEAEKAKDKYWNELRNTAPKATPNPTPTPAASHPAIDMSKLKDTPCMWGCKCQGYQASNAAAAAKGAPELCSGCGKNVF